MGMLLALTRERPRTQLLESEDDGLVPAGGVA
jgi:hypothetical protein